MLIHVTKRHIKNGKRHAAGECPLALAIKEQLKPRGSVFVLDTLYIGGYNYPLPKEVVKAISTYDKTGKMEPLTLDININVNFINI